MTTNESDQAVSEELNAKTGFDSIIQALGVDGIQSVIQNMGKGQGSADLIKSLVLQSKLPEDQKSMLETLLDTVSNQNSGHIIDGEMDYDDFDDVENEDDLDEYGSRSNVYDIRSVRQELKDMRRVNDTLANALGACPVCWGGDAHCDECDGEGQSGTFDPDPQLYNELVAPAVKRVRAIKRTRQTRLARKRR